MRFVNDDILSAVDSSTQTGAAVDAKQLISASFYARFTGVAEDAAGTVSVQASNDAPPSGSPNTGSWTPTNWIDIPNASAATTAGASKLITITQMSYRWIRVVYTRSSGGTGNVIVSMFAFGV